MHDEQLQCFLFARWNRGNMYLPYTVVIENGMITLPSPFRQADLVHDIYQQIRKSLMSVIIQMAVLAADEDG